MAFKVMLAGQDITAYVQEMSIKLSDSLGQGAGAGGGGTGRAKQFTFLTSLGPVATAFQPSWHLVGGPFLVRSGEVKVYDATGAQIFGGYATNLKDKTNLTRIYTEVSCNDYWQDLDRIIVNEVYSGQFDNFIINDLLTKYAPWIDTSLLPTTGVYQFGARNFQHFTLQNAIQNITDGVGFQFWITPDKKAHYINPSAASTAPFGLSDSPNNSTSFPLAVTEYTVDDNSVINRVYFYGGKHLSGDTTISLKNQCDGNADTIVLPWYPHKAKDSAFHILIGAVEQTFGIVGGKGAGNTLIRDGGSASILLDIDAHNIQFNTPPAAATDLKFKGRYEIPLVVVLTDESSHNYYGRYYDGVISDQQVFELTTALQRCRVLLLEQSYGLTTLKVSCWKTGIQVGQMVRIDHNVRKIHDSYIVQQVDIVPLGKGSFRYDLTLGAWNWNLVDLLHIVSEAATPQDDASDVSTVATQVKQLLEVNHTSDSVGTTTRIFPYYTRTAPVGDGHDAYVGLCRL